MDEDKTYIEQIHLNVDVTKADFQGETRVRAPGTQAEAGRGAQE